jgi:D-threo-aldose 1-dehydrogenase
MPSFVTVTVVFHSAGKYGAGLAIETGVKCFRQLKAMAEDVIIGNNKFGRLR